jgi:hypothetical protein
VYYLERESTLEGIFRISFTRWLAGGGSGANALQQPETLPLSLKRIATTMQNFWMIKKPRTSKLTSLRRQTAEP